MSRTQRRRVAAFLPVVGLALAPALVPVVAQAAPVPPVDPERKAEVVRDDYTGHVQVVRGKAADEKVLRGTVFVDRNKNSVKDRGENGIAGVTVSNGRDVVSTNARGEYALPVFDRMTVFVTQPAGYAVPVNQDNIAQFSYNHFPNGSPKLRFGGIAPTGGLPQAVNFPMVKSKATGVTAQNCAIASDTHGYNLTEVHYAKQGAVRDLVGRTDLGGCGVLLLGDNVGDDLAMNAPTIDIYRQFKGPVRALAGNHDMDYDAPDDEHSLDTHKRDFGPAYFSWQVGNAHIVALDNIRYNGTKPGGKWDAGGYTEFTVQEQIDWLKKDLANVPANKLVVVNAHSPFVTYGTYGGAIADQNVLAVFEALKASGRTAENTVLVGGHWHTLENLLAGTKRKEWADKGLAELPFTQLVAGAVSGDWYSGSLDEYGLPNAYMLDGSRPGVLTLSLKGNEYVESYQNRQEPWSHRLSLGVNSPFWRDWAAKRLAWRDSTAADKGVAPSAGNLNVIIEADLAGTTYITSNFYLGTVGATVEVSIDGRAPKVAEHTQPGKGEAFREGWEFSDVPAATSNLLSSGNIARSGSSLWRYALPADLGRGTHTATVKATDRHGRVYTDTVRFTVVEKRAATR